MSDALVGLLVDEDTSNDAERRLIVESVSALIMSSLFSASIPQP